MDRIYKSFLLIGCFGIISESSLGLDGDFLRTSCTCDLWSPELS